MGNEIDYPAPAPVKAKGALKGKGATPVAPKADKPMSDAGKPVKTVALDAYGFKVGTIKSKAAEMYARKEGATVDEVQVELNSLQLNLLTTLEKQGYEVRREKEKRPSGRLVTRYFLSAK